MGELVAACHRLAAWASWGESLAAACLTGCAELSTHPGQWGPDGRVSSVVGFEERRFNTTCLAVGPPGGVPEPGRAVRGSRQRPDGHGLYPH